MMRAVCFNGSPAGAGSATHVLTEAFFRGIRRAGGETEEVFLLEKEIGHCRGCFSCWFRTPGKCVLEDDMAGLIETYRACDVVCFGTPVYTWNMTAALKNFVDRLVPLKSPLIVQEKERFDLADTEAKTQKFVVIANCGFPGEKNFEVMKAAFACCGPALEIYRSCGKLLKSKDASVQKTVAAYLEIVEQAGYELASTGQVTGETRQGLEMALMPVPEYVRYLGM